MNKFKQCFLCLMLFSTLTVAAAAQTCNPRVYASAPDSRYTDNGDETVTDNSTNLMWKQCSEGFNTTTTTCDTDTGQSVPANTQKTWQEALTLVDTLNTGGGFASYTDWRLPNRNELASLIENKCTDPAINMTIFPNTQAAGYWTSSPSTVTAANAWFVNFSNGSVLENSDKGNHLFVRLVRDAP